MNLAKSIKRAVRKTPWLIEPITRWRGRRLERYMRAEEAYYAARCTSGGLAYSFESSRRLLAERLRGRDLSPKPAGAVNVFALFTDGGWEYEHWPRAWDGIGRVEYLDWRANGFDERSPGWGPEQRRRLSDFVVERVLEAHRRTPLDVFFAHVSADVLEPRAVQAIAAMGIFTFNLGLDDLSACFRGGRPTDERPGGTAGLASAFDLNVTTGRRACEKYLAEGGVPLYLGQGATLQINRPLGLPLDIDVSFVGNAMGTRWMFVRDLRRRGVHVQAFGNGFPGGHVTSQRLVEIHNRSRINLGDASIGDSPNLLCLKARDFEAPMSGGFYLTRYTPELADWYEIGKEVACYTSLDDLVEKIGYYLSHPGEAQAIARAGHARAVREYTWKKRFETVLRFAGVLAPAPAGVEAGAVERVGSAVA